MTNTFGAVLRDLAAADPTRPSITCEDRTLSRGEVADSVLRLAARLADLGVREGSFVTICLPNSIEFLQATLATWWLGGVPQPISPRLSRREQSEIIDLAKPAVVVAEEELDDPTPVLTVAELRDVAITHPPYERDAVVSPVWKVVTSGGSTGRPKLIVADQPADAEAILPLAGLLYVPREGCTLVPGPLTHNAPFSTSVLSLLLGNHVVLMPRFDAARAVELIDKHQVQWTFLVPTMMHRIGRLTGNDQVIASLSSLDVVFHGGAACPPWLKQQWIDWLGAGRVWELYGGTELQAMTVVSGEEWLEHPGSVGKPVIGEIECRDADGNPAPPGVVGELWLRREPGVAGPYRYIGADPKAADDGWESLGDLGFVDADGYVYITDRETDMIVVGGCNVYPAEVEAALDEHPAVRSSCVIGLPHEDLGNAPHAIVEMTDAVADAELLGFLRERLGPEKLPRSIERVDHPLRDDGGKVRRSALRAERLAALT